MKNGQDSGRDETHTIDRRHIGFAYSENAFRYYPIRHFCRKLWLRIVSGLETEVVDTRVIAVAICPHCSQAISTNVTVGVSGPIDSDVRCKHCQKLTIFNLRDAIHFSIGGDA